MPTREVYLKKKAYYNKKNKEYYQRHRVEILNQKRERLKNDPEFRMRHIENVKRWHSEHPERVKASVRKFFKKLRSDWGYSNLKIAKKAELLAVNKILPSLGFSNIIHLQSRKCKMFYDILAEKDGKKYGIQVKTTYQSFLKKKQRQVADFFGLVYLVLFVKPTLDYYLLVQASKKYGAFVNNKKNLIAEGKIEQTLS